MPEILALGTVRPKWFGLDIVCSDCGAKFRLTSMDEIYSREGPDVIWVSCPVCSRHGKTFRVDLSQAITAVYPERRCVEP